MFGRTINILRIRNTNYTKKLLFSSILPETNSVSSVKKINDKSLLKSENKTKELELKQYFLKDDPNMFGTLSTPAKDLVQENVIEKGDIKEEEFLSNPVMPSKKLRIKQYADIIKAHIKKRQIKEAIDVVETRMIVQDRVKPDNYIYNLLLGACGRIGYTKKAFKLFNDMKKRDLKPTNGTYTALFNACSNSPWIEDGLSRAIKLRELIKEKQVILNDTNYNAMIKAFGRCGDLNTAFSLVDEMLMNKIAVKEDTINFLLQSCISDKSVGYRHALLVWRKFHNRNISPNIYSFNLMLRCIRDCNLGDVETVNKLLASPEFKLLNNTDEMLQIQSPGVDETNQISKLSTQEKLDLISMPNLMAPVPYLGNIIKLEEITKPEHRLLLVGGCSGFLKNMSYFNVKPDIKTYTQLLDCIPSTLSAEEHLLAAMKKDGIKYDIDFLNMLIKKRSMRFDYKNAREVIDKLFKPRNLKPNIITYGVLALGCKEKEEAESLIQEMEDSKYNINIEILGAMLKQACCQMNFVYVLFLMELSLSKQINPNKMFIQHLEDLYKRCKKESNENQKSNPFFMKGFKIFRMRYKPWLEEIKMDTKDKEHPWAQFRNSTETNVKHYQNREARFKPKISTRFRVKTGPLNQ